MLTTETKLRIGIAEEWFLAVAKRGLWAESGAFWFAMEAHYGDYEAELGLPWS